MTGALLLLVLPEAAFKAIVPVLIALGCVLVVLQPAITRRVEARAAARGVERPEHGALWVWVLVYLAGVYGGYFGAAQGVLLMAILGVGLTETMQRNNAMKNVLAMLVNLVAAIVFIFVAHIDYRVAGIIAVGSVIGGQIGATVGRRLPSWALRGFIVVVGVAALVQFSSSGAVRLATSSHDSQSIPGDAQSVKQIARNRPSRSSGTPDVSMSVRL